MKYRGTIITMIVMLSIIIVLLVGILYLGITNKGSINLFSFGTYKAEEIIFDKTYDIALIKNIEVLSSAGDVRFEENNNSNIRVVVYGKEDGGLKVNLEEEKLTVDYKKHNVNLISFGGYSSEVIVYLPKDYDKDINVKVDYGNVEVTSLEKANINVQESCGNVELGKVKNVDIENNFGNVKIEEVLNKLNIKTDCGDVKIDKIDIKENSSISCDMGDVKIKEANDIYIEAKVDLGDCKIANNNRHSEVTLKIDMDCGDIKVGN